MKIARPKRSGRQILLEEGFLGPKKNAKDGEMGELGLFENQELNSYFTKWDLGNLFLKIKRGWRGGTWHKGSHANHARGKSQAWGILNIGCMPLLKPNGAQMMETAR